MKNPIEKTNPADLARWLFFDPSLYFVLCLSFLDCLKVILPLTFFIANLDRLRSVCVLLKRLLSYCFVVIVYTTTCANQCIKCKFA